MRQDTIFAPELKTNLPSASEAQLISQQLHAHICAQIATQGGKISFAEYMQLALYSPGLGYYSAGSVKFGAQGDFVTAPELGNLFAQSVAAQCIQVFACTTGSNTILEVGAGSGQLACDLLRTLASKNLQLDQYLILEVSADLKQRQHLTISEQCPEFLPLITWIDQLPSQAINGIILANEVLDAMPCSMFQFTQDELLEYYVTCDQNHKLELSLDLAHNTLAQAFSSNQIALHLAPTAQAYTSEINLWIPAWIASMNKVLHTGAILLIDYGFTRAEYYHPQREQGTLMCHYRHHSHTDPFANVGLQDITAHVDFTAVAEAAIAVELEVGGYTTLASFLLNCGITNFCQANNLRQAQELNILTSAAEMGELFKAMILTKGIAEELVGFSHYDKTHTL